MLWELTNATLRLGGKANGSCLACKTWQDSKRRVDSGVRADQAW